VETGDVLQRGQITHGSNLLTWIYRQQNSATRRIANIVKRIVGRLCSLECTTRKRNQIWTDCK